MLQTMRDNSQGIIAKIIVFFIVVVFALFGVESIVSLGGGEKPVATVEGSEVSELEIQRLVEQQKSNLRRQFGDQFDESLFSDQMLRSSAMDQLIEQKISAAKAEQFGVYASPEKIDETIVTIPAFQLDGKFDKDQFLSLLRLNGWTPTTFRASLADDLKIVQVNQAISQTDVTADYSAKLLDLLDQERRTVSYVEISETDLLEGIEVSDEQAQAYYDENQLEFREPEKLVIRYVGLEKERLSEEVDVTEDELADAYQDYLDQQMEAEQRQASHILIEINDDRSDAEAKEQIDMIAGKLAEGQEFAALASEYSDDIGSSASGGDLGWLGRGGFDPAFEEVLYSLEKGQTSAPVKTEYGYHIISLRDISEVDVASLEEKTDELSAWIRSEKAAMLLAEQSQELSNMAFSASSVEEVADALGLTIQESKPFTRANGSGLAADANVRTMAFADNMLLDRELSELIENDQGNYVFSVSEHQAAKPIPFEALKGVIVARVKQGKAAELAEAKAKAIAAGEEESEGWQSITLSYSDKTDLPPDAQQKAFEMASGATEVVNLPIGVMVVKLDAVERGQLSEDAEESQSLQESNRAARAALMSYRNWAEANSEVESPES